jgi:hypothetical protein
LKFQENLGKLEIFMRTSQSSIVEFEIEENLGNLEGLIRTCGSYELQHLK